MPAELVFDQGLGDLFVIRVAGNIVAPSQIGSVEFAAERFGTRLVVVLGHSQCGAVLATLEELRRPSETQSRNLRSIDMSDGWRCAADVGLTALTLGTSWARIEAGWHYPSDTLVGMAIGNFLGSFFNDAFLGLDDESTLSLSMQAVPEGAGIQWRWRF